MPKLKTFSSEETKNLAQKMAENLKPGSVLALVGDLGSGKTCFVQGLAAGLKIPETVLISSPTYVLVQEYSGGRLPLYHFDFYRLEKEEEAFQLGLNEYFEGKGICVVEWADRFEKVFPEQTEWIYFKTVGENEREIITAC
ncbi:MAG: tRNA (adenosine(37)-N6)-threonylcarbamoyltransferase complex ATPase subunit type 1 TsaE [Deltaproteobacteria bacterium]|nr:tRNA (adenosine(37)-N6)-threonylcarbamoyltransferase complex ATPase subunit type 1 TsaE [Deltaproteobacteria bacterium]